MEIIYKIMTPEDVLVNKEQLIIMLDATLKENLSQKYPSELAENYVEKMPGYIEDGSAIIIGAFDCEKMIGFLWGYEMNIFGEKRVHTAENHVLNSYRGMGIARQMLLCLEDETKKRGICILEAMCTASNEGAYNYHIKNGYEIERVKFKKVLNID